MEYNDKKVVVIINKYDSVDKLLVYDNLSHIAFDETRYASRGSLSTLDDRSA